MQGSLGLKVGIVVAVLALVGCDSAQSIEQTKEPALKVNQRVLQDEKQAGPASFLLNAYSYSLLLEAYSSLADTKATTPAVQSFAHLSAAYHRAMAQNLQKLAKDLGIVLPETVGGDVLQNMEELRQLSDKEFEVEYLEITSTVQEELVNNYETALEAVEDPKLRQWMVETLPNIRAHVLAVKELNEQLQE